MKIIDVKRLNDGVSNITIEGRITKVLKPRHSQYGWSQFVVIKDDSDNMGSNINIENEEAKYQGGEYIQVKGKVSRYVKGDKPNVSLNGNVIEEIVKEEDVSQEKPQSIEQPKANVTTTVNNKDMDKVWEDKDLRMARESALKNIARYVVAGIVKLGNRFDYAHEDVDFIYNGLEKNITNEAITKEFGGTAVEEKPENPYLPEGYKEKVEEGQKEQKIAQAKEIANQASQAQKDMVEKIIKSRYITEKEVKNIGDLSTLTKDNANKYISYWFGNKEKMGERDKRELEEREKNPLITDERQPIEKKDPNGNSLTKDVLIDDIQALRKKNHLQDDEKFGEALKCNAKFKLWTEKELTKLKKRLETYRPSCLQ